MASSQQPLSRSDYTVACICPLGIELAPVMAMLDHIHPTLPTIRDQNAYTLGSIGHHNVVVAAMPEIGNNNAATVAIQLVNDFPSVRFALLVGVGGGVPGEEGDNDIRLGDVVVSQPSGTFGGVVQYDLGKALTDAQFKRVGQLNKPPAVLSANVRKLQAQHLMSGNYITQNLSDMMQRHPRMDAAYFSPPNLSDQLFLASYVHQHGKTCEVCDPRQTVHRLERSSSEPHIHYGTIGSANMVVKDSVLRESLLIRGICDYADSHKNKGWQPYAAAVAAAYIKELLIVLPSRQVLQQKLAKEIMVNDPRAHELLEESNKILRQSLGVSQKQAGELNLRYETERERECHQAFKTSPYEQFKNNNPDRIPGTCKWVLEHDQFNAWKRNDRSDLLWISADPGCGKSVLVRSLVDIEFRDHSDSNICYFFFKDNENQDDVATALCAVLHQLFTQQPALLRHVLSPYDKDKAAIRQERHAMWQILLAVATDPSAKPTFYIFDALDECREDGRAYLISKICEFYAQSSTATQGGPFKFLVTSRPYDDVRRWFRQPPAQMRHIWLRGELENDQINQEINLVIDQYVRDLTLEFSLPNEERENLIQSLRQMQHRTYLWLYLSIEDIRANYRDRLFSDEIQFDPLPQSVEEAYERILNKIDRKQESKARAILSIILGARRPLTISEMALALGAARAHETDQSIEVVLKVQHLEIQIRNLCGLFVFVNHSQLFLIHQTAKEFLLTKPSSARVPIFGWISLLRCKSTHRWASSFKPKEIETKMAVLYATSLYLGRKYTKGEHNFFHYCAEHWASHLTNQMLGEDSRLLQKAVSLYDIGKRFHFWFPIMWGARPEIQMRSYTGVGPQHAVAMNGHVLVLEELHSKHGYNLNARDGTDRTALHWAVEYNHEELSIDGGSASWSRGNSTTSDRARCIEKCLPSRRRRKGLVAPRITSRHENSIRSLLDTNGRNTSGNALLAAAKAGDEKIVQLLLDRGVNVNTADAKNESALQVACMEGKEKIVEILLERGADIETLDKGYRSLLQTEPGLDHKQTMQRLLELSTTRIRKHKDRRDAIAVTVSDHGHGAAQCPPRRRRKTELEKLMS